MQNERFSEQKQKEQDFFKTIYFKDKNIQYELTQDEFCPWDATSDKFTYELKIREFTHNFFLNEYKGEPLIEVQKYNALIDEYKKTGKIPILIFTFQNKNLSLIQSYTHWNLLGYKGELKTRNILCPKSELKPELGMEYKPCYLLSPSGFNKKNTKHFELYDENTKSQGERDWEDLQEFWEKRR